MSGAGAKEPNAMKLEYDRQADAIYIRLKEAEVANTRELDENVIVDLDAHGRMVGIELLFVSDYLSAEDIDSFTVTNLRGT
ncbi:MAG TPA: DUF2283 domain-containing protein [Dehalococcoidia bacterium]|nr:DUF2283 domain-containing protein [Dehalococcoidia bacterium]